ncbi:uncharacterized protein LOC121727591 [Aricia agestis]|uniref:uncharacterized protein LOC121727591 n=1 Tax=Aricia agestis TaxID=91739 RepID=UPI001C202947|nr:uncharacterized protein LOC121727591 [Aricia agestis]
MMTAIATASSQPATATSQAVAEWVRIFPKGVTENVTSSTSFMKQLTIVAVSTVTYLKNIFPEDSYMTEHFAGVKLRILKKKCRDELAQFLSTSLIKGFEAIDKKYLKKLVLCFYDKECKAENLIEYHSFEFSYTDAETAMSMESKTRDGSHSTMYKFENVRERTLHLIRACVVITESCQPLPENYELGIRLYYNDAAPADYQAPGFLPVDGPDHITPLTPHAVKLGWVATPFHRLTTRTYVRDVPASHEPQASQSPPILNETNASDEQMMVSESEPQLICSCRRFDVEGELLICFYCNTRQHAACYGVISSAVREHCCVRCSDADPTRVPTDPKLASLQDKKREVLCIFRRTLIWCRSLGTATVSAEALAVALQLTDSNAARLMKMLRNCSVLPDSKDSIDTPQHVQPDGLRSVMKKYFHSIDIVERLVTESTSEVVDPLGEVLSPLEMVNLQESIGRLIDNQQMSQETLVLSNPSNAVSGEALANNQDTNIDSTLNEYREAFISQSVEPMRELRSSKRKTDDKPAMGLRAKRSKNNKI